MDYEDVLIAKYDTFTSSKTTTPTKTSPNVGIRALGYKIFSKINKLNSVYF